MLPTDWADTWHLNVCIGGNRHSTGMYHGLSFCFSFFLAIVVFDMHSNAFFSCGLWLILFLHSLTPPLFHLRSSDTWGFGCLTYYLCYGKHPGDHMRKAEFARTLLFHNDRDALFPELFDQPSSKKAADEVMSASSSSTSSTHDVIAQARPFQPPVIKQH